MISNVYLNINIGYSINLCKFDSSKWLGPGKNYIPEDNQLNEE